MDGVGGEKTVSSSVICCPPGRYITLSTQTHITHSNQHQTTRKHIKEILVKRIPSYGRPR